MKRKITLRSTVAVVMAIATTLLGFTYPLFGQVPEPPATSGADSPIRSVCPLKPDHAMPLSMGRLFLGTGGCNRCHANQPTEWIKGDEYNKWHNDHTQVDEQVDEQVDRQIDKHVYAYVALLNGHSRQMGVRLGVEEIHRDARCLACHSAYPIQNLPLGKNGLVPNELGISAKLVMGVSCEGCHGASENGPDDKRGWRSVHEKQKDNLLEGELVWRFISPSDKQKEYGFYDVRSPSSRVRMCVSCHIGSAEDGRVVTHEMYAAGHPPLPAFETVAFERMMPPHWTRLSEKNEELRKEYLRKTQQPENSYDSVAGERLRSLAVGSVVAWSQQLRLAADLADRQAKSPAHDAAWPELAQFECFACHHDLRDKSWRQQRLWSMKPGRPFLHHWPTPLARAVVQCVGAEKDLGELVAHEVEIMRMLSNQPFGGSPGGSDKFSTALRNAAMWADKLAVAIEARPFNVGDGKKLLLAISQIAAQDLLEYNSARQLSWAFRGVLDAIDPDEAWQDVRSGYKEIVGMFVLELKDKEYTLDETLTIPLPTEKPRTVPEVNLKTQLPPIAAYDATKFREQFGMIQTAVNKVVPPASN